MLSRLLAVALLFAFVPVGASPSAHYVPKVNDGFTFHETIAVNGGMGNYSGYTETDSIVGTLNVTAVLPNGTETAKYDYSGHYSNSQGASYPWSSSGTFTFSATTFDYVSGTDNQTGDEGLGVWFYMNNTLPPGSTFSPLGAVTVVEAQGASYALGTAAGTDVSTIYTDQVGAYLRDDDYGVFNAVYDWRSYFDPTTGYIVAYDVTELDSDSHGDGFVYTDSLAVTATTYPLTSAPAPSVYPVTVSETGLGSGASWTVLFNGVATSGTGSSIAVGSFANGSYLFGARSAGGTSSPFTGFLTVSGTASFATVQFTGTSGPSSPGTALWLFAVIAIVVVIVVVVIALALRRARRGPQLPRHSAGGMPRYVPPPPGPTPPPISLRPGDQPRIQQVVVKEVVKVNCRYCGSLIDSTAETCPFCGATRT